MASCSPSSSSSSSETSPLVVTSQGSLDQEDAAAAPSGSGQQQQQEVMRSWAETMLCCCGADCGRLWRRVVLRKWLNVGAGSGDSDFSADEDEDEPDHQGKCCCEHNLNDEERRLGGLGAGTIGTQMEAVPYMLKICKSVTLPAQYIDITELRYSRIDSSPLWP